MSTKLYNVGYGSSLDQIEDSVKGTLEDIKLENKREDQVFSFKNVHTVRNPNGGSISKFKEAILSNRSILSQVYGDVYMKDGKKAKKLVAKKVKLASMPQMLDTRGTFVVRGSDYNIVNQLRKNPAPYITHVPTADIPVTATFNLSKGRNFAVEMDPRTSKFVVVIGSSHILLKALVEVLNITRADLVSAIGEAMTRVNYDQVTDVLTRSNLNKLYKKVYEYKHDSPESFSTDELLALLRHYYTTTTMDPHTTNLLYGQKMSQVDGSALITVLREYMAVYRKEKRAPNQDELYYQKIYTPNLLFGDRIRKMQPTVEQSLGGRVYRAGRDKKKIDYGKAFEGIYSNPLISMVTTSDLARLDPQYNPLGILATPSSLTPLGLGGVSDVMAVRDAQRDIQVTSIGISDPMTSPQGQNTGLLLRTTNNFKVDGDGRIHLHVKDKGGKKTSYEPLSTLKNKYLAMPDVRPGTKSKLVSAIHDGHVVRVNKSEIDHYYVNGPEDTLNSISNLLPMANAVQGNRNFMSTRQVTQSLPLVFKEAPLVQTVSSTGENFYNKVRNTMGAFMPFRAPVSGKVTKIKDGVIHIKGADGKSSQMEYTKHLPLATNTGIHQVPTIHAGDVVKKNQIIVKDNYTTDDGKIAFGATLRTAFMPYHGHNSEDAVVISERAANKMTSVHYYKFEIMTGEPNVIGKRSLLNGFPNKYTPEQLENIGEDGRIHLNTKVKRGDPLVLALSKVNPDETMKIVGRISKDITVSLSDVSLIYDHDVIGEVIEVSDKSNVLTITVKTLEKAVIGDKLAGLYGNKGTVSLIVDNKDMMRTPEGDIVDLIYAASVVPSRMNPAQIHEQALGKIVKKTGKPYLMEPLTSPKGGLANFVKAELKKHKVKDKDVLFDPTTDKNTAQPVANGFMYTMKLLKADKDFSARGIGPSYSSNQQPTKGGHSGAKAIGQSEFYALVAHNARNVMTDMATVKGQFNPDYWRQMLYGSPATPGKESFAFQRFKASLTSAGAVFDETADGYQLLPLTDRVTDKLAGHRVIKTPALLNSKTLEPMKEGLYDKATTGGVDGALWSKIKLSDGMISPLLENYVRLLLDMNKDEVREWQANKSTTEMRRELNKIDTDTRIRELRAKSKTEGKLSNNELKLLRFLNNAKDKNVTLGDMIITSVPVPPPKYRPMTQLGDNSIQIADVNHFYKDVMIANDGVKATKSQGMKSIAALAKQEMVYNVHALVGTEKTKNRTLKNKGTRNILDSIGGVGSPKQSFVHSNLIKKNQDLSARARIIPNASLNMDEVGIPLEMAWGSYAPFIKKRLVSSGLTPVNASKELARRTKAAKAALVAEVDARPVMLNRAPTLHRFGFLGAKPILVTGNNIQIPLSVTSGYNADFDGDAMQIHVPASQAAIREIDRLTLSNNLMGDVSPDQIMTSFMPETTIGFYDKAAHDKKGLLKDIRKIIPTRMPLPATWDKKGLKSLLLTIAKDDDIDIAKTIHRVKLLGDEYATEYATTVGIDDISAPKLLARKDKILSKVKKDLTKMEKGSAAYAERLESAQKDMMSLSRSVPGDIGKMLRAGVKGSDNQISGMILSPVIAYNPRDPIATATLTNSSYTDGLPYNDFFNQIGKARTDAVKTAMSVALPGSLSKLVTSAVNRMVIVERDCEIMDGMTVDPSNSSIRGSLLAAKAGKYNRNTIIDEAIEKDLRKLKSVIIRSPQTCGSKEGVCARCYGADSKGKLLPLGTNVGMQIAHGLAEPLAQMALDSKHGGRSITKDVNQGGLVDISKIFSSNSTKAGMAIVPRDDGTVASLTELPSGAHQIVMKDGDSYVAGPELSVNVKEGSSVSRGKPISDGIIPFTDVIQARGIVAGRKAMTDQFRETLAGNGKVLSNRVLDLLGKATANYVTVFADIGTASTGDTILYSKLKEELGKKGVQRKLSSVTTGMQIAEEFGDLSAGTVLTDKEANTISSAKTIPNTEKTFIRVMETNIPLEWVARSIYTAGLTDDDWMHHVAAQYIKRNVVTATAEGYESKKKTLSPVNVWMQGKPMNTSPTSPYYNK